MPWWGSGSFESPLALLTAVLLGSPVVLRQNLDKCCSSASAPCVPGQETEAAVVTREGPDISGDIVCLLNVPERGRRCKEGRGNYPGKPTKEAAERVVGL